MVPLLLILCTLLLGLTTTLGGSENEPSCFYSKSSTTNSTLLNNTWQQESLNCSQFRLELEVIADTNLPLKVGQDYDLQIYFANVSDIPTFYRIFKCNTRKLLDCDALINGVGTTTDSSEWNFKAWPQGSDTVTTSESVHEAGSYAIFVHVQQKSDMGRLDLVQVIDGFLVFFTLGVDPIVLTNSRRFMITISIFSSMYALLFVAMLVYIILHRKHPLMKLAQAPFLALQMGCATICVSSVFVFLPKSSLICNLHGLCIIVPTTLLAATLVGRLWRTYSVVSVALKMGKSRENSSTRGETEVGTWMLTALRVMANFHLLFQCKDPRGRGYTLRSQVTSADLTRLIFVLCLPQVILQIVQVSIKPRELVVDYLENGQLGRQHCSQDGFLFSGIAYLCIILCTAIFMAWVGRDLPSMLNEKDQIFRAGTVALFLSIIVGFSILLLSTPTSNPDVLSFLWIFLTDGIVSAIVWSVIFPKIRRVLQGNKVIISNLFKSQKNTSMYSSAYPADTTTPIVLKLNDPPPRKVETQILHLKDLLWRLSRKSLEGDRILLDDWDTLKSKIALLQNDLNRIEFTWTKADEDRQSSGSLPSQSEEVGEELAASGEF